MRIDYRYKINDRSVSLVVDEKLSKVYTKETNQMFLRPALDGKMKLMGPDFDYVLGLPLTTEYVLSVESSIDGGDWQLYCTVKFYKTDCDWNEDDKVVQLKTEILDQYTKVMEGYDNEYDLTRLKPARTPIRLNKRPLIQTYIPGEDTITGFVGGTYFEQEVIEPIDDTKRLENEFYFALGSTMNKVYCDTTGSPQLSDFDAVAKGKKSGKYTVYFVGNDYDIQFAVTASKGKKYKWRLYRRSDGALLYESNEITAKFSSPKNTTLALLPVHGDVTGYVTVTWQELNVYMRYVLDKDEIFGKTTYRIPLTDFVGDSRNYKYCIGYAFNLVTITTDLTLEPTEYGLATETEYFDSPNSIYGTKYYPISKSNWGLSSLWFKFSTFDTYYEEAGRKEYTLFDSFELSSVIRVLLNEIDPSISHYAISTYSKFFYQNSDPIAGIDINLHLAPKSNILAGEYDKAAKKAPITLSQVMEMLRNVFKCYFYIEDGKFKIEHISFFRNGGSYTPTGALTADLNIYSDLKNKKPYSLYDKKYKYEKPDMVNRFQFKWMDTVTNAFEGHPIIVNSGFVQKNKVEDINVTLFNTDVDFMLLNPNDNSPDGFALLSPILNGQIYELPIVDVYVDNARYRLQNGYLSWPAIHNNWWLHDMPSYDLTVNQSEKIAKSVSKLKTQDVRYPSIEDPDTFKLVNTNLGMGKIEKMSINLASRYNEIELRYDTE